MMVSMESATKAAEFVPSTRLWQQPSWLLNMVSARANRLVSNQFGQPGIRRAYALLAGLEEFGPISQAELGRRLGVDRSDIVTALNQLVREGLAVRAPDAGDRRRNAIQITPAGVSTLLALDDRLDQAQAALLEPLGPDERAQFKRLLQRLLEHHTGYQTERFDHVDSQPSG